MLALDRLREADSGVGSGKLRAVSEGMGLGLRGDCPVKGTEEAQSTAVRSCPHHLLIDLRKPHSQAHLHSPPHAFVKGHSFLYKAVLITFLPQRFYRTAMVFVSHCLIILRLLEEDGGITNFGTFIENPKHSESSVLHF